jgi:hypothetical protein
MSRDASEFGIGLRTGAVEHGAGRGSTFVCKTLSSYSSFSVNFEARRGMRNSRMGIVHFHGSVCLTSARSTRLDLQRRYY